MTVTLTWLHLLIAIYVIGMIPAFGTGRMMTMDTHDAAWPALLVALLWPFALALAVLAMLVGWVVGA